MRGFRFAKGRGRTRLVLLAGLLAGLALVPGQARAMAGDGAAPVGGYSIAGQVYAGYWNGMMARNHGDGPPCKEDGRGCPLGDWQAFLDGLRGDSAERQLVRVNRYINRVRYRDDRDVNLVDAFLPHEREDVCPCRCLAVGSCANRRIC